MSTNKQWLDKDGLLQLVKNLKFQISLKVDKVDGKGLSTNDYTTAEKTKLSGIETNAQKNTITGVKGDSETSYRTGNINITKANIGLSAVENKSSSTIRGELTKANVTDALGYTPPTTNTTYSEMTGASSTADGTVGLVPKPIKGNQVKYLRADGTWNTPTDTKYTHPTATAYTSGLYKVTVDGTGHVTGATAVTKADITGLGIPASDTNTWTALKGASSTADGTAGYVSAPPKDGYNTKYLRADGTWTVPPNTDTVYTHPTTSGNKHIPSGGSSGQFLKWSSDGTAVWANDNNTTYTNFVKSGTTAAAGLVPAPPTTAGTTKYLREDGTWQVPPDNNTVYTHPTTTGNKHIPSGGSSGQILRWSADGTAVWGADNDTTYSNFVKSGSGAKSGLVPAPSTTAGTTKYLREDGTWTVPPDTNTFVKQTNTTTTNFRPILLGYNNSTDTSALTTDVTNQTYETVNLYAQPSTGNIYSTGTITAPTFKGSLTGNASTASKWATARTITLGTGLQGSVSLDGSANVTLNGSLKHCLQYDETSDFASYAWHKFAETTITTNNADSSITFCVSKSWGNVTTISGILTAHIRSSSAKVYETAQFQWLMAGNGINPDNFVMVYTNTANTSVKVELWYKQEARYDGWSFTVLKEHSRTGYISSWTLFTASGHGSANYTTGTGTITSSLVTLKNSAPSTSHTHNYAASSSAGGSATTVQGTLTNPTSLTTYAIPFHSDVTTGAKTLRNNDGLRYLTLEGTASALGYGMLALGNSTASGTAANKYGYLRIFGKGAGYTNFIPDNTSATNYTINIPAASGTLALTSHTHEYLPLAGGTMTGAIKYNSGTRTSSLFTIDDGDANGAMYSGPNTGGLTILGGGESASSIRSAIISTDGMTMPTSTNKFTKGSESLILSADSNIYFMTNCNTVADRKSVVLTNTLSFAPDTTNTGSVGTSSYKWANMYATTFNGALSGNATTASKWETARNINGLSVNGSADRVNYGLCETAAATAAKTLACTGFALITGSEITVKFKNTNTAANPTLNVNSTGAKPIYYRGSAITAGYLAANRTYTFRYDGTNYDLVGDINTNTTYSNFVKSGSSAKAGLVPAPSTTAGTTKYLREDGTWQVPPNTNTNNAVTVTGLSVTTTTNNNLVRPLLFAGETANPNNTINATTTGSGTKQSVATTYTGGVNMTSGAYIKTNYWTNTGAYGYTTICAESFEAIGKGLFHGGLAGNATTATTLQTARKINGVEFNGSIDISIVKLLYSGTGSNIITLNNNASNYNLFIVVTNVGVFLQKGVGYSMHTYTSYPTPSQNGSNYVESRNLSIYISGTSCSIVTSNYKIYGTSSSVTSVALTQTVNITEVYGFNFS